MDIELYDNIDVIMDQGAEMIELYRNDPVLAAYDLLKVDLAPIQRIILRDMWFKNFAIVVMGRGLGKSQSVDSMSFINDSGLCYLYEMFDSIPKFLSDGQTIEVSSDDRIYTSEGFKDIKSVSLEKNIKGLKITTNLGLENKGSSHHPILTVNENGDFYYKQLKDFKVGDYVCIQRGQQTFGNVDMSTEDAYLIGLFIGDGMINYGYNHQNITTSDKYIENFCVNYCNKNNISYRIDEDNRTECTKDVVFKKFDWFFDKYNIKRCLSYNKEVPKIVRESNKRTQISFLKGLFDTDGGVESNGGVVCFSSTSKKLIKEVQMMLLNLGIISRKSERVTKSTFGRSFRLIISGEDIKIFYELVGFNLVRKQGLLNKYIKSIKFNTNTNIIPFIKNTIVRKLAEEYGSERSFSKKILGKNSRYRFDDENRKNLSYNVLDKIVNNIEFYNVDSEIYNKLLKIRNKHYYFDIVTDIKSWSGDCYDFEMSMGVEPNYFCNGFINHNTYLLGVNAALHALLYPGYRIGLISSSFRQAKYIFSEIEKLYTRSSILREACEKRPVRGSDVCYLKFKGTDNSNGSHIEALPLGVDGAKIRGSRFYLIEIDELAQVPSQIIDMVIRPFGAVTLEPMEKVRYIERMEELISKGLASRDDIVEQAANKMMMTSSGYFKFNHMWKRMKAYWQAMKEEGKNTKYAVYQVPYTMAPEGFLDKENIKEAKRTMSNIEFMMEYEAAMISDSDGFFKASLLESCTLGSGFSIRLSGEPNKKYVLGIDPSQGGAASCGLVMIELGKLNKIIFVRGVKKKTTQEMTMTVQELTDKFNVIRIFMDSQGGGKPIKDLLQEGYNNHVPIIDIGDETMRGKDGKHILQLVNPVPAWISDANFDVLALLENESLRFPEVPSSGSNIEEKLYEEVSLLKSQMLNIIVTETSRGTRHFDTPKKGQNKDLYSALILAAWGAKELSREVGGESPVLHNSGLVRPHQSGSQFVNAASFGKGIGGSNRVDIKHALLSKKK